MSPLFLYIIYTSAIKLRLRALPLTYKRVVPYLLIYTLIKVNFFFSSYLY